MTMNGSSSTEVKGWWAIRFLSNFCGRQYFAVSFLSGFDVK